MYYATSPAFHTQVLADQTFIGSSEKSQANPIPQPDPTPRVLVSHSESPDLRQGFWTKRVRRMIHPSGGRRGRIIRSSLDYLTQSVKESLYRGSEIRRFTSDLYTPNFSSLVCRSGPPSTKPALGGEGQQSLKILRIFQSSQILRIFQSSHQSL